ncbi:hypothetical protein, conserved [Eimeria acervulina]|uniref:Uncharacterized protein n=1 Tax=Eimeria acervulina TaxID=5801 RepID=U6GRE7_EIMAC|nr:hypothetical protein, conserved [Eimeria acervulina]CDI81164.1 hypothetical protein, conserved [Eimeria acervulina]
MPCAECWAAAGGFYPPAADQDPQQVLAPYFMEEMLKPLQQSGELTFLPQGSEKTEKQQLQRRQQQQHQRRQQQRDQNEKQQEHWTRTLKRSSQSRRGRLLTHLLSSSDDCKKSECCSSEYGSSYRRHTSSCTDTMDIVNCRNRSSSGGCSTIGRVDERENGAQPKTHSACRDIGKGAAPSEAKAAKVAAEAHRRAITHSASAGLHVRALELLQKLSPFPEGSCFIPSVQRQLHRHELNPSGASGIPCAVDADIVAASASAMNGRDLETDKQTASRTVQREQIGVDRQQAQQQQEMLGLEAWRWQALDDFATAAAPLHRDIGVLLPEKLETLLLKEPSIRQQQPSPAQQQQIMQRDQQCAAQLHQVQGQNGCRGQNDELCQPPKCKQESRNGSDSTSIRSSNNRSGSSNSSGRTQGCIRAFEVPSLCSTPCSCDSRNKRRPGSSSCWQQTAALLNSFITIEDRLEQLQQQYGTPTAPDATCALKRATYSSGSASAEEAVAATNALGAPASEKPEELRPASVFWASAAPPPTDSSIPPQQQHAEPHAHQSLPAEVAQQILWRITSATVDLHRHCKKDGDVHHQHSPQQKTQLVQEEANLQQDVQQEEQKLLEKGSEFCATCCCSVKSCRSFCARLVHLLGDVRVQQKHHERLHLLLLQLLLLLLQDRLACSVCRCDSGFLRQYRAFVVEQIVRLLQLQQGEDEQLAPDWLALDADSLHHQKRLVLLLQLALLLRAWRASGCTSGSKGVVKVAYLCLHHLGVCFELREAAADILAAAALDELSVTIQEAAIEAVCAESAWCRYDEAAAADGGTAAATAAVREAGKGASSVSLCNSIIKAAVKGNSAAAAAATELATSVACCFLLMLQQSTPHPVTGAAAPAADLKAKPYIREFLAEAAAPAFPLLLLLLLPALEQQSLKGEGMQDTAATPFSLSLHAAEAIHLLRIAILHVQQHQLQQRCQMQIKHQPRQRCISNLLALQQWQLLGLLEQRLMRLLRAAIRTCTERFDLLLALLQRERPDRSKASSTGTSWNIVEAAAAAAEAPLCCVCVLVQLPRLSLAAVEATNNAEEADTLEDVVSSLVNLLLRLVSPCVWTTHAPAPAAGKSTAAAAGLPATESPVAVAKTMAFGCLGKLLVALREAARSACVQIQQSAVAAAAPGLTEGAAFAAGALRQCFARGVGEVMRLCLESAEAGRPLQQQEHISDFFAAAADADIALLRLLLSRKEQQQLQQPLACRMLQQILQSPIIDRREGSKSCSGCSNGGSNCSSSGSSTSPSKCMISTRSACPSLEAYDLNSFQPICNSGGEDATANTAATSSAAALPLAWVAVETSAAAALQTLARFLESRKMDSSSATATRYVPVAASSDGVAASAGAAAVAAAARLLRTTWIRVVGPAVWGVCVPYRATVSVAGSVMEAANAEIAAVTPTAAAATTAEAASVRAGQQHALAIIETRGNLICAFSSAMTAAASAALATAGEPQMQQAVQYELQQLQCLQQDFTMALQNATLSAAHVALSHQQPWNINVCCRSIILKESCASTYWNIAQHQDPVGALQQVLRALLVHYAARPTNMHSFQSCCTRCNGGSCLWRVMLQVAVAFASLRSLALQLLLWPLRSLLTRQPGDSQQHQSQRQFVEIWHVLYPCFSQDETAAAGAAPNSSNSRNGCCCCSIVKLEDFLQQDDWVQVSDLLLELIQLLQQTAGSVSAVAASAELPRLAAAAAAVQRAAATERAYRRPPRTQ